MINNLIGAADGVIVIEAEALNFDDDFVVSRIDSSASGGEILRVRSDRQDGNATTRFEGPSGIYDLTLYAYDENDGNGRLKVWVNGQLVNSTTLNQNLGVNAPNQMSQFLIGINQLSLNTGDEIEIEATRDRREYTSLDKLVFVPVASEPIVPDPPQPSRIVVEAEDLNFDNDFVVSTIDRGASGGEILRVRSNRRDADATMVFNGVAGNYTLTLDAYDENDGSGQLKVFVNGQLVSTTLLNQNLGSNLPNSRTRVQITTDELALSEDDVIRIEATRDRNEYTSLDRLIFDPVVAPVDVPVEFISNGGGNTAFINIDEGTTAVTDLAVNVGDENVEYRINNGADRDLFNIDAATGALSFKIAPDYESPADVGADNVYEVNVIAIGANSGDGQFISVQVNDVADGDPVPPVQIISNDTGAPNNGFTTVSVLEGIRSVTDVNVVGTESDVRYRINAGADQDLFFINPDTGVISFKQPPDFENPQDAAGGNAIAGDNTYEINILAERGTEADSQFMTITVQDTDESTLPAPVPVYLMAGQSNLVGVGDVANLTDTSFTQPFSPAPIWSRPTTDFVDLASGFDGQTVKLGPELSFGRQIVANTGADTYLIKYGLGATNLAEDWQTDGSGIQYNTFRDVTNRALDSFTNQGLTYQIEGLVWMQGESDTYNDAFAAAYEDNLLGFFAGVRDTFGENLDIAVGLIRNDLPTSAVNRELVRDAQRAVSAGDANVFLVDTDALGGSEVLRPGDTTHYNADGQILLGNAFADAFV